MDSFFSSELFFSDRRTVSQVNYRRLFSSSELNSIMFLLGTGCYSRELPILSTFIVLSVAFLLASPTYYPNVVSSRIN